MKIGSKGLSIIKHYEGFKAKAYICPAGVLTIGYGTTKGVKSGQVITESIAESYLVRDITEAESVVLRNVKVKLNQDQFDALVCFVYNVGSGNFRESTLLKKLNSGLYEEAANQILRWDKAGGKVLAGLTKRRLSERDLFLKGVVKFYN